jgi:hypothetical protein
MPNSGKRLHDRPIRRTILAGRSFLGDVIEGDETNRPILVVQYRHTPEFEIIRGGWEILRSNFSSGRFVVP